MTKIGISTPANPKFPERTERFEEVVQGRKARLKEADKDVRPKSTRETGKLYMENVPVSSEKTKTSWQPYHDMRGSGFLDFDSDGELYAIMRPNRTDPAQVHRLNAPKGSQAMVTSDPDGIGSADSRPLHNDEFVFPKDTKGDEFDGLFLKKADGTVVQLTEPGTRNNGNFFTPDGKTMIWGMTRKDDPTYTVMMMNPDDLTSRREVFKSPWTGSTYGADLSDDGTTMLLGRYISANEGEYYTLDLATGKTTEINPTDRKISYGGATFTADGKSLIVTTDDQSEFKRLARIDIATGVMTPLTADTNWDVEGFTLSPDRKRIAYVTNEDGISKLTIRDMDTWAELPKPDLPYGLVSGLTFDDTGTKLGFTLNAANTMGSPHTWDIENETLEAWVDNDLAGLDPSSFVQPELIHYTNKNGDQIPAFVYKPKGLKPGEKVPVIVEFHGGPESQSRPYFDKEVQYYVNELGVAVIKPNVRGSTGYGKSYVASDNGENRMKSVDDGGDLFTWIEQQPDLDAKRVAVMGTSYGGFMTHAMMTYYPDKIVGGIPNVGPSNLKTFLTTTQGYRRDLRRVEYGDERNPAMAAWMDRTAPLNHTNKIEDPMLVIQGANDPRVPMMESEQMVSAARKGGNEVWYMLGDEGHGFGDLENIWEQREVQTEFLKDIFGLEEPKKKRTFKLW